MAEQEMKEYVDSLERELYGYRKLGTQRKIKAALRRDSKARRRKNTIIWCLKRIPSILSILWLLWIFLSWMEVAIHNSTPGYDYCFYNFFKVMF